MQPQTQASAAPAPYRLVADPFYADVYRDHFKRVPTTLADLAACREELSYRRRIAEVRTLAPKLALLDALMPQLAPATVADLARRDFMRRHVDGIGVVLRLLPGVFSRHDDKLQAAFLAVGFREIARRTSAGNDEVTLKHGRALFIMLDVSTPPPPAQS